MDIHKFEWLSNDSQLELMSHSYLYSYNRILPSSNVYIYV